MSPILVKSYETKPVPPPNLLTEILDSVRGRFGLFYVPLWLFMVFVLIRYFQNPDYNSFIGGINLAIHETGHLLFFFVGGTLYILGGTLVQLAVPLITAYAFKRQRDYFAVCFALLWFATNCFVVATYIADAPFQDLPLVSFSMSNDTIHDWAYLLSKWNILNQAAEIAGFFRLLGYLIGTAGVAGAAGMLYLMLRPLKDESS